MRTLAFIISSIVVLLLLSVTALAETPEIHLTFIPVVYNQVESSPTSEGTPEVSATPTVSATPENDATPSVTVTIPVTETPTANSTETPTATPVATASVTATESATATAAFTATAAATPSQTPTATDVTPSTATPTVSPTVTATATGSLTPTPIAGDNLRCRQEGTAEICAWVSDGTPARQSIVTLYGRYLVDGEGVPSKHMISEWRFKDRTSECDSGFTSYDGVAHCARGIGDADPGFEVEIDVTIGGYTVTTSFTPVSD